MSDNFIDIFAFEPHEKRSSVFAWVYLAFAAMVLVSWVAGFWDHDSGTEAVCMFALWIVCVGMSYVLTGFEVAFTDLRDKDPMQAEEPVRSLLPKMQADYVMLYAAKEWCTVLVTVAFTLIAERHFEQHIDLLVFAKALPPLRLPFVLAFTTVPILWLAQSPAKRKAAMNSEAFLARWGRPTWAVVRFIGTWIDRLRLSEPAELLVERIGIGSKRELKVSPGAHFMMSLRRFGHGFAMFDEHITIHADGTSTLEIHCVALRCFGDRPFRGKVSTPSGVASCDVTIHAAYQLPRPGEQFKDLEEQIQKLGTSEGNWRKQTAFNFRIDTPEEKVTEIHGESFKTHQFFITPSFDLTEDGGKTVVLDYTVKYKLNSGVYVLPPVNGEADDFHERGFDSPTAHYKLRVDLEEGIKGTFAQTTVDVTYGNDPHEAEAERVNHLFRVPPPVSLSLPFPLPGGRYRIRWKVWPSNVACATSARS